MKVELLKTLKGYTQTWPAGEVFEGELPEEIQSEIALDRGVVRVIEEPAPAPPPIKEEEPERDRTEGLQLDEALAAIEEVEEGKPPPEVKRRPPAKKKSPAKKKPALAKRKKK